VYDIPHISNIQDPAELHKNICICISLWTKALNVSSATILTWNMKEQKGEFNQIMTGGQGSAIQYAD
jgi:hypothetical protein